jgi:hypothetical protein
MTASVAFNRKLGHICVGEMDVEKQRAAPGDLLERIKEEMSPLPPSSSRSSAASLNARQPRTGDDEKMQTPFAQTLAQDVHAARRHEEKDPFEVGWDGGDDDPLCPRSMAVKRKWSIVLITCFGSLCV